METPIISTYILPTVLGLIMLGMGLTLTLQDFRNIFLQPKAVTLGLVGQLILLPLTAFGIASISGLSPEFKVGLILISACPGGAVSNLISYMLRGNVALSVSMTTINSFLVVFTIPTIVGIALEVYMGDGKTFKLPFWDTFFQVLLMTVLPCLLGIWLRRINEFLALVIQKPLNYVMPTLLAVTMLAAIFLEKSDAPPLQTEDYLTLIPFTFLLNFAGMFLGYFGARILKLTKANQTTIAIEVGLQNTGLAITVATSSNLLGSQEMGIPAGVYALFTFFTALGFGYWVNREAFKKKSEIDNLEIIEEKVNA